MNTLRSAVHQALFFYVAAHKQNHIKFTSAYNKIAFYGHNKCEGFFRRCTSDAVRPNLNIYNTGFIFFSQVCCTLLRHMVALFSLLCKQYGITDVYTTIYIELPLNSQPPLMMRLCFWTVLI